MSLPARDLHTAITSGDPAMLDHVLTQIDIAIPSTDQQYDIITNVWQNQAQYAHSPLYLAVLNNNQYAVELICGRWPEMVNSAMYIDQCPQLKISPLSKSIIDSNHFITKTLVKYGASIDLTDINALILLEETNQFVLYPLLACVLVQDWEILQWLVEGDGDDGDQGGKGPDQCHHQLPPQLIHTQPLICTSCEDYFKGLHEMFDSELIGDDNNNNNDDNNNGNDINDNDSNNTDNNNNTGPVLKTDQPLDQNRQDQSKPKPHRFYGNLNNPGFPTTIINLAALIGGMRAVDFIFSLNRHNSGGADEVQTTSPRSNSFHPQPHQSQPQAINQPYRCTSCGATFVPSTPTPASLIPTSLANSPPHLQSQPPPIIPLRQPANPNATNLHGESVLCELIINWFSPETIVTMMKTGTIDTLLITDRNSASYTTDMNFGSIPNTKTTHLREDHVVCSNTPLGQSIMVSKIRQHYGLPPNPFQPVKCGSSGIDLRHFTSNTTCTNSPAMCQSKIRQNAEHFSNIPPSTLLSQYPVTLSWFERQNTILDYLIAKGGDLTQICISTVPTTAPLAMPNSIHTNTSSILINRTTQQNLFHPFSHLELPNQKRVSQHPPRTTTGTNNSTTPVKPIPKGFEYQIEYYHHEKVRPLHLKIPTSLPKQSGFVDFCTHIDPIHVSRAFYYYATNLKDVGIDNLARVSGDGRYFSDLRKDNNNSEATSSWLKFNSHKTLFQYPHWYQNIITTIILPATKATSLLQNIYDFDPKKKSPLQAKPAKSSSKTTTAEFNLATTPSNTNLPKQDPDTVTPSSLLLDLYAENPSLRLFSPITLWNDVVAKMVHYSGVCGLFEFITPLSVGKITPRAIDQFVNDISESILGQRLHSDGGVELQPASSPDKPLTKTNTTAAPPGENKFNPPPNVQTSSGSYNYLLKFDYDPQTNPTAINLLAFQTHFTQTDLFYHIIMSSRYSLFPILTYSLNIETIPRQSPQIGHNIELKTKNDKLKGMIRLLNNWKKRKGVSDIYDLPLQSRRLSLKQIEHNAPFSQVRSPHQFVYNAPNIFPDVGTALATSQKHEAAQFGTLNLSIPFFFHNNTQKDNQLEFNATDAEGHIGGTIETNVGDTIPKSKPKSRYKSTLPPAYRPTSFLFDQHHPPIITTSLYQASRYQSWFPGDLTTLNILLLQWSKNSTFAFPHSLFSILSPRTRAGTPYACADYRLMYKLCLKLTERYRHSGLFDNYTIYSTYTNLSSANWYGLYCLLLLAPVEIWAFLTSLEENLLRVIVRCYHHWTESRGYASIYTEIPLGLRVLNTLAAAPEPCRVEGLDWPSMLCPQSLSSHSPAATPIITSNSTPTNHYLSHSISPSNRLIDLLKNGLLLPFMMSIKGHESHFDDFFHQSVLLLSQAVHHSDPSLVANTKSTTGEITEMGIKIGTRNDASHETIPSQNLVTSSLNLQSFLPWGLQTGHPKSRLKTVLQNSKNLSKIIRYTKLLARASTRKNIINTQCYGEEEYFHKYQTRTLAYLYNRAQLGGVTSLFDPYFNEMSLLNTQLFTSQEDQSSEALGRIPQLSPCPRSVPITVTLQQLDSRPKPNTYNDKDNNKNHKNNSNNTRPTSPLTHYDDSNLYSLHQHKVDIVHEIFSTLGHVTFQLDDSRKDSSGDDQQPPRRQVTHTKPLEMCDLVNLTSIFTTTPLDPILTITPSSGTTNQSTIGTIPVLNPIDPSNLLLHLELLLRADSSQTRHHPREKHQLHTTPAFKVLLAECLIPLLLSDAQIAPFATATASVTNTSIAPDNGLQNTQTGAPSQPNYSQAIDNMTQTQSMLYHYLTSTPVHFPQDSNGHDQIDLEHFQSPFQLLHFLLNQVLFVAIKSNDTPLYIFVDACLIYLKQREDGIKIQFSAKQPKTHPKANSLHHIDSNCNNPSTTDTSGDVSTYYDEFGTTFDLNGVQVGQLGNNSDQFEAENHNDKTALFDQIKTGQGGPGIISSETNPIFPPTLPVQYSLHYLDHLALTDPPRLPSPRNANQNQKINHHSSVHGNPLTWSTLYNSDGIPFLKPIADPTIGPNIHPLTIDKRIKAPYLSSKRQQANPKVATTVLGHAAKGRGGQSKPGVLPTSDSFLGHEDSILWARDGVKSMNLSLNNSSLNTDSPRDRNHIIGSGEAQVSRNGAQNNLSQSHSLLLLFEHKNYLANNYSRGNSLVMSQFIPMLMFWNYLGKLNGLFRPVDEVILLKQILYYVANSDRFQVRIDLPLTIPLTEWLLDMPRRSGIWRGVDGTTHRTHPHPHRHDPYNPITLTQKISKLRTISKFLSFLSQPNGDFSHLAQYMDLTLYTPDLKNSSVRKGGRSRDHLTNFIETNSLHKKKLTITPTVLDSMRSYIRANPILHALPILSRNLLIEHLSTVNSTITNFFVSVSTNNLFLSTRYYLELLPYFQLKPIITWLSVLLHIGKSSDPPTLDSQPVSPFSSSSILSSLFPSVTNGQENSQYPTTAQILGFIWLQGYTLEDFDQVFSTIFHFLEQFHYIIYRSIYISIASLSTMVLPWLFGQWYEIGFLLEITDKIFLTSHGPLFNSLLDSYAQTNNPNQDLFQITVPGSLDSANLHDGGAEDHLAQPTSATAHVPNAPPLANAPSLAIQPARQHLPLLSKYQMESLISKELTQTETFLHQLGDALPLDVSVDPYVFIEQLSVGSALSVSQKTQPWFTHQKQHEPSTTGDQYGPSGGDFAPKPHPSLSGWNQQLTPTGLILSQKREFSQVLNRYQFPMTYQSQLAIARDLAVTPTPHTPKRMPITTATPAPTVTTNTNTMGINPPTTASTATLMATGGTDKEKAYKNHPPYWRYDQNLPAYYAGIIPAPPPLPVTNRTRLYYQIPTNGILRTLNTDPPNTLQGHKNIHPKKATAQYGSIPDPLTFLLHCALPLQLFKTIYPNPGILEPLLSRSQYLTLISLYLTNTSTQLAYNQSSLTLHSEAGLAVFEALSPCAGVTTSSPHPNQVQKRLVPPLSLLTTPGTSYLFTQSNAQLTGDLMRWEQGYNSIQSQVRENNQQRLIPGALDQYDMYRIQRFLKHGLVGNVPRWPKNQVINHSNSPDDINIHQHDIQSQPVQAHAIGITPPLDQCLFSYFSNSNGLNQHLKRHQHLGSSPIASDPFSHPANTLWISSTPLITGYTQSQSAPPYNTNTDCHFPHHQQQQSKPLHNDLNQQSTLPTPLAPFTTSISTFSQAVLSVAHTLLTSTWDRLSKQYGILTKTGQLNVPTIFDLARQRQRTFVMSQFRKESIKRDQQTTNDGDGDFVESKDFVYDLYFYAHTQPNFIHNIIELLFSITGLGSAHLLSEHHYHANRHDRRRDNTTVIPAITTSPPHPVIVSILHLIISLYNQQYNHRLELLDYYNADDDLLNLIRLGNPFDETTFEEHQYYHSMRLQLRDNHERAESGLENAVETVVDDYPNGHITSGLSQPTTQDLPSSPIPLLIPEDGPFRDTSLDDDHIGALPIILPHNSTDSQRDGSSTPPSTKQPSSNRPPTSSQSLSRPLIHGPPLLSASLPNLPDHPPQPSNPFSNANSRAVDSFNQIQSGRNFLIEHAAKDIRKNHLKQFGASNIRNYRNLLKMSETTGIVDTTVNEEHRHELHKQNLFDIAQLQHLYTVIARFTQLQQTTQTAGNPIFSLQSQAQFAPPTPLSTFLYDIATQTPIVANPRIISTGALTHPSHCQLLQHLIFGYTGQTSVLFTPEDNSHDGHHRGLNSHISHRVQTSTSLPNNSNSISFAPLVNINSTSPEGFSLSSILLQLYSSTPLTGIHRDYIKLFIVALCNPTPYVLWQLNNFFTLPYYPKTNLNLNTNLLYYHPQSNLNRLLAFPHLFEKVNLFVNLGYIPPSIIHTIVPDHITMFHYYIHHHILYIGRAGVSYQMVEVDQGIPSPSSDLEPHPFNYNDDDFTIDQDGNPICTGSFHHCIDEIQTTKSKISTPVLVSKYPWYNPITDTINSRHPSFIYTVFSEVYTLTTTSDMYLQHQQKVAQGNRPTAAVNGVPPAGSLTSPHFFKDDDTHNGRNDDSIGDDFIASAPFPQVINSSGWQNKNIPQSITSRQVNIEEILPETLRQMSDTAIAVFARLSPNTMTLSDLVVLNSPLSAMLLHLQFGLLTFLAQHSPHSFTNSSNSVYQMIKGYFEDELLGYEAEDEKNGVLQDSQHLQEQHHRTDSTTNGLLATTNPNSISFLHSRVRKRRPKLSWGDDFSSNQQLSDQDLLQLFGLSVGAVDKSVEAIGLGDKIAHGDEIEEEANDGDNVVGFSESDSSNPASPMLDDNTVCLYPDRVTPSQSDADSPHYSSSDSSFLSRNLMVHQPPVRTSEQLQLSKQISSFTLPSLFPFQQDQGIVSGRYPSNNNNNNNNDNLNEPPHTLIQSYHQKPLADSLFFARHPPVQHHDPQLKLTYDFIYIISALLKLARFHELLYGTMYYFRFDGAIAILNYLHLSFFPTLFGFENGITPPQLPPQKQQQQQQQHHH